MLLLSVGATAFQCGGHRPSFMTAMTRRSQMSSSTDTPLTFADYMARRNGGNQVEAPPPDVSAVEAKARWLAQQSAAPSTAAAARAVAEAEVEAMQLTPPPAAEAMQQQQTPSSPPPVDLKLAFWEQAIADKQNELEHIQEMLAQKETQLVEVQERTTEQVVAMEQLKVAADQELIKAQEEMAHKSRVLEQTNMEMMHQASDEQVKLSGADAQATAWLAEQKATWLAETEAAKAAWEAKQEAAQTAQVEAAARAAQAEAEAAARAAQAEADARAAQAEADARAAQAEAQAQAEAVARAEADARAEAYARAEAEARAAQAEADAKAAWKADAAKAAYARAEAEARAAQAEADAKAAWEADAAKAAWLAESAKAAWSPPKPEPPMPQPAVQLGSAWFADDTVVAQMDRSKARVEMQRETVEESPVPSQPDPKTAWAAFLAQTTQPPAPADPSPVELAADPSPSFTEESMAADSVPFPREPLAREDMDWLETMAWLEREAQQRVEVMMQERADFWLKAEIDRQEAEAKERAEKEALARAAKIEIDGVEIEPGVDSPHEMMQRRLEFWQKAEIEAQERAEKVEADLEARKTVEAEPGVESPHEMMQRRFEFWNQAEMEAQAEIEAKEREQAKEREMTWSERRERERRKIEDSHRANLKFFSPPIGSGRDTRYEGMTVSAKTPVPRKQGIFEPPQGANTNPMSMSARLRLAAQAAAEAAAPPAAAAAVSSAAAPTKPPMPAGHGEASPMPVSARLRLAAQAAAEAAAAAAAAAEAAAPPADAAAVASAVALTKPPTPAGYGEESPMPGREAEYEAAKKQAEDEAAAIAAAVAAGAPAPSFAAAVETPALDNDRKGRSPGIRRNFYEMDLADFKRPHGTGRGVAAPAPVAPPADATATTEAPAQPPIAFGEESPMPGRETDYEAIMAQAEAEAAAATPIATPPIDEERRSRSPGLQRAFYEMDMDDFKRPHGLGRAVAAPAPEAPPAADAEADVASPEATAQPAVAFGEESAMPGRETEYEEVVAQAEAEATAAPTVETPPIDEERRSRSPGLQRNFYEMDKADFMKPHGMGRAVETPVAPEAPPADAVADTEASAEAPSALGEVSATPGRKDEPVAAAADAGEPKVATALESPVSTAGAPPGELQARLAQLEQSNAKLTNALMDGNAREEAAKQEESESKSREESLLERLATLEARLGSGSTAEEAPAVSTAEEAPAVPSPKVEEPHAVAIPTPAGALTPSPLFNPTSAPHRGAPQTPQVRSRLLCRGQRLRSHLRRPAPWLRSQLPNPAPRPKSRPPLAPVPTPGNCRCRRSWLRSRRSSASHQAAVRMLRR